MSTKLFSVLGLVIAVSALSVTTKAAEQPPRQAGQIVSEIDLEIRQAAISVNAVSAILSNTNMTVPPGHTMTIEAHGFKVSITNMRNPSCCVIC